MTALLELSRKESIEVSPDLSRDELIDELFEAFEEDRRERENLNNLIIKIEESKFSHLAEDLTQTLPLTEDPVVPESYDENRISLVLRDPTWALAVWEVRKKDQDTFSQEYSFRGYGLKVLEHPHLTAEGGTDQSARAVFLIPIGQPMGTRYIHLPTEGVWYSLELHALYERESRNLARSTLIFSPPELPANPLERRGLTPEQKKILELSGAWACETNRDRAGGEDIANNHSAIPQRIGDWDESALEAGS